jgi:phage terminase large subunit-like protein
MLTQVLWALKLQGHQGGTDGGATSDWAASGGAGKDVTKEWLDKGHKWLMSATKKVAAAAKEASSSIQSKLEDMDVFKPSSALHGPHLGAMFY